MTASPVHAASSLSELTDELDQLRELSSHLAHRLVESANVMLASGAPPAIELLDEIRAYRRRVHGLVRGIDSPIPGSPVAAVIPGNSNAASDLTLAVLQSRLDIRQRREIAESLRRALSQLQHVDQPMFEPLVHCVQQAARLCELVSRPLTVDETAELDRLDRLRPVLNSLLRLADEGQDISDQEWTECYDSIAATYGRQLATALTRGRIRRALTEAEPASGPASPPSQMNCPNSSLHNLCAPQSEEVATRSPEPAGRVPPVDEPHVPASIAVVNPLLASAFSPLATTGIELNLADGGSVASHQSDSPHQSESIFDLSTKRVMIPNVPTSNLPLALSDGPLPPVPPTRPMIAASRVVMEDAGVRAIRMADEIVRLLNEDRLPVALQLTRCLEMRPEPSTSVPPSWLLRALILGRHLSYSKGEIAWQLDHELRNFRPEMLLEGSEDRQLVMGLLLRAAALPAALLAGSTAAAGVLRAFKIAPGFSQLYNYCSRIAYYSDRLDGSLVELFRPAGTSQEGSERADLARIAGEWLQNAANKATTYTRTSPLFLHAHWTLTAGTAMRRAEATQLWCKWQETLLLAQRLLKPVCEGLNGERHWVRQEIARLTSQVRVEPFDSAQKRTAPSMTPARGIVLPVEEMHVLLLEAIAIANRWLRIRQETEPREGLPVPQDAIELRSEILQRSKGVIEELVLQRQAAESPLVKASLACCQAAVRQIESLFELKRSLPAVEPDPLHVLNADLLRIPGLVLNEQWQPDSELAVVERELLASLQEGELSWRESFEFHAQAGNHDVTGRLLDLDVWKDSAERETLRTTREAQISETRRIIAAEIDEITSDIESTPPQSNGTSSSDRAAFLQRVEELRRELPRVLNFGSFRRRVSQLHSMLHRRTNPLQSALPQLSSANAGSRPMDSLEQTAASQLQQLNDAAPFKNSIFDSRDAFPRKGKA